MKGAIYQRADTGWWYVVWYDRVEHKNVKIVWYKGERMYSRKLTEIRDAVKPKE